MTDFILDQSEIERLTGKHRRPSQCKVLNALGIEHKVRPDGSLVVSRSHCEESLGGKPGRTKKVTAPNWNNM